MKLLMENWRMYGRFQKLLQEKEGKAAKFQKELELINSDPEAYIEKRKKKLEKGIAKHGGGEEEKGAEGGDGETAETPEEAKAQMQDLAQDAKQDIAQGDEVEKQIDTQIAKAEKSQPEDIVQKAVKAREAVDHIFAKDEEYSKEIIERFQQALGAGDFATSQKTLEEFDGFREWSAKFLEEVTEAYAKGWTDPVQFDEVIKMAQEHGFGG